MRHSSNESTGPTLLRLTELELQYLLRSKIAVLLLASFVIAGIGSAIGLVSTADTKLQMFNRTLTQAQDAGDSLTAALSRPLNVTSDGQGGMLVDNPLRYDFEQAQSSFSVLHPLGFSINALQSLMFLVVPLAAILLALALVTRDYRLGTLKVRSSRASFRTIRNSQFLATVCSLVFGTVVAILSAVAAGALLASSLQSDKHIVALANFGSATASEFGKTFGLEVGVGAFFAAAGWGIGLIVRQALIPAVAFTIWDLMCPLLGRFDPRTLWLTAARALLVFRGSFEIPTLSPTPALLVVVSLCAMAGVVALAGVLVSNRVTRYT